MRVRVRSSRDKARAFFSSPKPRWSTLLQLAMLSSEEANLCYYIFFHQELKLSEVQVLSFIDLKESFLV